jgi:hypothetical protein
MMEHAHIWAICDQKKQGIWGSDTNHDVHMLQPICHRKVDEMMLAAQAAEHRVLRPLNAVLPLNAVMRPLNAVLRRRSVLKSKSMNQMQMKRRTRRMRSSFLLVGGALVAIRRRSLLTPKSMNQMQMTRRTRGTRTNGTRTMLMRTRRTGIFSNATPAEKIAAIAPHTS